MQKTFYPILANSLIAFLTNNFVWFAVTFWVYLETNSVIAVSTMVGLYLGTVAVSGFFLGSLVDRYRKKSVMMLSSVCSFMLYTLACLTYTSVPPSAFTDPSGGALWIFITLALVGATAGNVRAIALATLVTILVNEEGRAKANGLVGTANGVAFFVASILSGMAVGFLDMLWTLALAVGLTAGTLVHLRAVAVPEMETGHAEAQAEGEGQAIGVDIRGTVRAIRVVPGLFALIFFNTFNNFLGGVFMALLDAYGLSLVSVQVWGVLWGFISLGLIVGGLAVARVGLGQNPVRTLFLTNIILWTICVFFAAQASVALLTAGLFIFLCFIPAVEAAEQTIMQKVIPYERQGRVFALAQSVEQMSSPLTAFLIGPIAQFVFIPFMTTGRGADLIGNWFGTGSDRGIALLFCLSGIIGLTVTLAAMRSSSYRRLSSHYEDCSYGEAS